MELTPNLVVYRSRKPKQTPLWQVLADYFDRFEQSYDNCYTKAYGFFRPVISRVVRKYPDCGDMHQGFARLDHSFERGLEQVAAEDSLGDKGEILVINRGYDPVAKKWKEARGRAYFVDSSEVGMLKVSFFGPFYGGYNIVALDRENYSYALVCGPTKKYLWILSKSPVWIRQLSRNWLQRQKS